MTKKSPFDYMDVPKSGFYLVGLVDILGQKQSLVEIDKVSVDNPQEFSHQFVQNLRAVQRLRHAFKRTYDTFLGGRDTKKLKEKLSGVEREIYEYYLNPPEIKFQGFSDTLVFYVDLSSQKKFLPTSAILASLVACSAAMSTLMALGHAIRGGIDVGRAGEVYENEIYGPALNCAYHLESKDAKYPRILIGKGLLDFLQAMANIKPSDFRHLNPSINEEYANYLVYGSRLKETYPEDFQKYMNAIKADAKLCFQALSKDQDQSPILDYFGEFIHTLLSKDKDQIPLFKMAFDFAKNKREEFDKNGDTLLHGRYIKLCHYLKSRANLWSA